MGPKIMGSFGKSNVGVSGGQDKRKECNTQVHTHVRVYTHTHTLDSKPLLRRHN